MVTSLNINENLLQEALSLDRNVTVESMIEIALHEYVQRRKHLKLLDLFGAIDYDETYNYKQQRYQA
jgi:hypothetical protein